MFAIPKKLEESFLADTESLPPAKEEWQKTEKQNNNK